MEGVLQMSERGLSEAIRNSLLTNIKDFVLFKMKWEIGELLNLSRWRNESNECVFNDLLSPSLVDGQKNVSNKTTLISHLYVKYIVTINSEPLLLLYAIMKFGVGIEW